MIPIELSNIWMVDSAWSIMKSILITYSTINLEYLIFMLYVICVMPWLLNENEIRHNSTHKKKLVFNSFLCFYLFFFLAQIVIKKGQSLNLVTMNHQYLFEYNALQE